MFRKLLVPLDRSPLAEQAVGRAAAIARATNAELDLVLVHESFPVVPHAGAPWENQDLTADQAYVEAIANELRSGAAVAVTSAVMRGAPAQMIVRRARDVRADLIVMTSHGRTGFNRAWLGSIADAVVRHSRIPVLLLRSREEADRSDAPPRALGHVLVTLDGSGMATDVLPAAIDLARASSARVTLLRVVPHVPLANTYEIMMPPLAYTPPLPDEVATAKLAESSAAQLAEMSQRLRESTKLNVTSAVIVGDRAAEAIVNFARGHDVDAIAMASHGHGMSRLLLGSVADKVLRASGLPVLMFRPASAPDTATLLTDAAIEEQLPALAGS